MKPAPQKLAKFQCSSSDIQIGPIFKLFLAGFLVVYIENYLNEYDRKQNCWIFMFSGLFTVIEAISE